MAWITACSVEDIDPEDVMRFDHGGKTYAIYRDPKGAFFATAGLCSHEQVHLCDGLVMGDQIECPKHNGRFNFKTGAAQRAPVSVNLKTFATRVQGDDVQIEVD
ncbi:MAG: Rieske 2Fe-2S domain-containing protein [Candidatus Saccharibacteria bacterium]|nr:Rieske 2Fe-2S domain-containing protein [Pseudorhodobacter sp.]